MIQFDDEVFLCCLSLKPGIDNSILKCILIYMEMPWREEFWSLQTPKNAFVKKKKNCAINQRQSQYFI